MKIFISQFGHETNTFAADRTDLARFQQYQWRTGQELLQIPRSGSDYLSGMIGAAEDLGVELVPGFATFNVGGLILDSVYGQIKDNILTALTACRDEIDGVCLSLHGAAVSEGIDDLELDLLRGVRDIVGPDMPVMATFDLHGNISAEMTALLNGVFNVKEYPHIDSAAAGYKAMTMTVKAVRGKYAPQVACHRIPMLIPCATASTFQSPAKDIKEYIAAYAEEHGLVDISFFHGFPYADVPAAGATVVANADGDPEKARRAADEIGAYIWGRRHEFDSDYLSVDRAVEQALAMEGKPIVINETSDNPGGGTPADGTHLLRELLRRDLPDTCFGFIYDPEFVALATEAGVGGKVSGPLGGKTDRIHGEPIQVEGGVVRALTDGCYRTANGVQGYGTPFSIGKTARVQIGNVNVIVGSIRFQTMDDRIFLLNGVDVRDCKIVALKSSQHFRSCFEKLAAGIVTADPPGIHTANFSQLRYDRLTRPIYPIDPNP